MASRGSNIVIDQDKVESLNVRLNETGLRYDTKKSRVEEVAKKLQWMDGTENSQIKQ